MGELGPESWERWGQELVPESWDQELGQDSSERWDQRVGRVGTRSWGWDRTVSTRKLAELEPESWKSWEQKMGWET